MDWDSEKGLNFSSTDFRVDPSLRNIFSGLSGWGRKRPETENEKKARLEHEIYIQSLNDSMKGVHSGNPNVHPDPEPFALLTNQNKLSESEYKKRFPMLVAQQAQEENLIRMRENLMRMQGGLLADRADIARTLESDGSILRDRERE